MRNNYDLTLYHFLKPRISPVYLTSSEDETYIRCPFCGDSKHDSRKARFYISNTPPFKFICFNCDVAGVINDDVLNIILNNNFYDDELSLYLRQKRRESMGSKNKIRKSSIKNPYFRPETIINYNCNKKYHSKLDYLNDRLGINLDLKDLDKFKIVLSIRDFFKNNGIDLDRRIGDNEKLRYTISNLNKNYIGFLSSDRNIIIFRNTKPIKDKREKFNNFKIFPEKENSSKTYNISTKIDKFKDRNEIVIAEGPIDILGTYFNVCDESERKNMIFMANGGKSYINSVSFINSLTLLNNEYTIMSDNDVNIEFYKRIKKVTPGLNNNDVGIYYNRKTKDFGTTKDNIELSNIFLI